MKTGSDNTHDLHPEATHQVVEKTAHPSKLHLIVSTILGAFAGFIAMLLTYWVPARHYNSLVDGPDTGGAAGVALAAFLIGTPLACGLGPTVGMIGGLIGGAVARPFFGKLQFLTWPFGVIGGFIAGVGTAVITLLLYYLRGYIRS